MKCIKCNSEQVQKDGNHNGYQRYKCLECKKRFDYGKYEGTKIEYINHFNVNIRKTDRNKLTRENYCIPTNKVSYVLRKSVAHAIKYMNYKVPNEYYLDTETYTDKYVNEHYNDCMYNFDLNMNYFSVLDKKEFNNSLNKLIKKHKFKEVFELNKYNEIMGIYIIVLDEYKQIYIGVSENIKHRIMNHWNAKKDFDRLIFGKKDKSILSIDSFGALDTTRIFVKNISTVRNLYLEEEKIVADFDSKYRLNRVAGGINSESNESIRNLKLIASKEQRNFENN